MPTREFSGRLSYPDTRADRGVGSVVEVPNGHFLSAIEQAAPPAGSAVDGIVVFFTPTPGSERVAAVGHSVHYERGAEIRVADFRKAFSDKYGEPPSGSQGRRRPPLPEYTWNVGGRAGIRGDSCYFNPPIPGGRLHDGTTSPPNFVLDNASLLPTLVKKGCGPSITYVTWEELNPGSPPDQRLVSGYTIAVMALDISYEGLMSAARLAKAAQDTNSQAATKGAARQPAPTL